MFFFVYGTLKQGHGNARLMDGAIKTVVPAVVHGYTLFASGIPYAAPARGFRIVGELVEIDATKAPNVLKRLDSLEGHPNHYLRTPVTATRESDGVQFAAFMYVVVGEPHGTHLGESWPPNEAPRPKLDLDRLLAGDSVREADRRPRFAWACVGASNEEPPLDVSDVWVVKVRERPGHKGPVTWDRKNGQTFERVLGPVRNYRHEARTDRGDYLKRHKLSNSQRADYDTSANY